MSVSSISRFEELKASLDALYDEVDMIMSYSEIEDSKAFKQVLSRINSVYSDLSRITVNETEETAYKTLEAMMKDEHVRKARFDTKASEWLETFENPKEISSIVTAPRSLRSRSARSKSSSSSSVIKARAAAKLQIARLKVKQLQEQQRLQRERAERQQRRELEETEARQRREREEVAEQETIDILTASHELEQASLEHQVLEEELDRGGYIPEAEDEEWRLEASSVRVSNRPSPKLEINKIGIASNRPVTDNAQNLLSASTAPAPSVHVLKPKKFEESACENIPSTSGVKDVRFENNPAASSNSFNVTDFTFTRPVANAGQNLPATSTTPARFS